MAQKLSERLRVLPALLVVAGLCFTVRLGEFAHDAGSAFAQQEVKQGDEATPPPLPSGAQKVSPANPDDTKVTPEAPVAAGADTAAGEAAATEQKKPDVSLPTIAKKDEESKSEANWRDAGEEDFTYSGVQEGLYRDLTKRREDIEKREKALATREALLEAAEREFDQKLRELSAVRTQIESLMAQQTEEEKARTASLVKIYEGMKAKDAARIFNTLETDVLLRVLTSMSERKSSPIIAEMDPERARNITILMAQQTALPQLPAQ